MTYNEANQLMTTAVPSNKPSRLNPSMTQAQAIDIVQAAIQEGISLGKSEQPVFDWLEKRVHQVVKNQRRPKY